MHDQTVRISDWYRGSENILRINMPPAAAAVIALVIGVSGCAQQQQRVPGQGSVNVMVSPPASQTTDSAAAQAVTVEAFRSLLTKEKGHPVVVCIWSAESRDAVPALFEALQWQAQRQGSGLLGICLDPADRWATKAVPALRKVGPSFPCVTIVEGHERQVLALCGVGQVPKTAQIVLLDEAGRPITPGGELLEIPAVPPAPAAPTLVTRTAPPAADTQGAEQPSTAKTALAAPATRVAEPIPAVRTVEETPAKETTEETAAGLPAGVEQAIARVAAEHVARTEAAATLPANAGNTTVLLLYSLQLVRLGDGTKVAEHRGTVVWQDVVQVGGKAGEEGLTLRRLGLSRLGQEIAGKASHEGAVGICPLQCVGVADSSANMAEAFAEGLSEAVQEAGAKAVPPAEVRQTLKQMGMGSSAVVLQPSTLKASLKAAFLLSGTLTVSTMEKGPM